MKKNNAAERRAQNNLLLLTALFVAAIWAAVGYWGVASRAAAQNDAKNVIERMNVAVEEQVRGLLKTVEACALAVDVWIAAHPGRDPRADPDLARLVERYTSTTNGMVTIRLIDAKGGMHELSSAGRPAKVNLADRDYFKGVDEPGRLYVGTPVLGRNSGKWVLPLSYRLQRASGDIGMLLIRIDMERLRSLFERQLIYPRGTIAVVRRDGVIVARVPDREALIGKSMAGGDLFRHLPLAPRGYFESGSPVTDRVPKMLVYSAMPDFPLVVVVSAGITDVTMPWLRSFALVAAIALALTVLALLAASRMRRMVRDLQVLATTDFLTQTHNRRRFLELLDYELSRADRYERPLSLLVFDLDHFKQINDRYGHAAGDLVLKAFVGVCSRTLRSSDHIGRIGGEEFAALLPDTPSEQAIRAAERIREGVETLALQIDGRPVRFTCSIGVSSFQPSDASIDALLARADQGLYQAKESGRNRVVPSYAEED